MQIPCMHARSPKELQGIDELEGDQSCKARDAHQGDIPYCALMPHYAGSMLTLS